MNIERKINLGNLQSGEVDCNSPVQRYSDNPILKPSDVNNVWTDPGIRVFSVHNAGIAFYQDYTLMLFRSHLRCGKSIVGIARSSNGINNWKVDPAPALLPATINDSFAPGVDIEKQIEMEAGGVEDPRISKIDGTYAITYSAYHANIKNRVRVCLATTTDFKTFVRHGPILQTDMRNVVIFPEKFEDGRYAALFRPNDVTAGDIGGIFTQIRIGFTDNWQKGVWDIAEAPIARTGFGPSSFSDKIGPGAPPIKTTEGWLNVFHGVRGTMDGNPYVLGVALHDLNDPSKIQMSSIPILFPSKADCRLAETEYIHVPNVVFTCGAIRRDDGTVFIYYGGNDTVMNLAVTHEDVLIELCRNYGQDPKTGAMLYKLYE
jgi:predicted GH43/DUF377 family glycosyl hydrolase